MAQALRRAGRPSPLIHHIPIVRPVIGDVALIKQLLDIGAQTLLIPMIETARAFTDSVEPRRGGVLQPRLIYLRALP